jgi:ABC-type transport system involved in cytochrome bd biosynthesis fused ATPase/permease subunit
MLYENQDVKSSHAENARMALRDISLNIEAREKVVIVGRTGR